jgi:hypothetical protein
LPLFFRCPKTFGASDDLIQFLQHLNLLVDQQLRITNHVDKQQVRDLEQEISL